MQPVSGYTFTQLLGKGTYGEVFKAINRQTRTVAAVKRIPKNTLSARAVDNLIDEIRILKELRHRNITQLIDFTWDSNYVYMFIEYMSGGDLSHFLRSQKRLPERVIRYFLQQLAFALHYLFQKNIVHMDIKPQNILLTSSSPPTLKLTDFGFAQSLMATVKMGEIRGSLLYMAPEIYCYGIYDKSCDLWSVGVILFECLFGRAPFASASVDELTAKLTDKSPVEIPLSPPISEDCRNLLSRLLKRDPGQRIHHEQFFNHPFIDLSYAPCPESLLKAVDHLEKASELEASNKLVDAYLNYKEGLLHLASAVQFEGDVNRKRVLREQLVHYITVAEQLKERLNGHKASLPCAKKPHQNPSRDSTADPAALSRSNSENTAITPAIVPPTSNSVTPTSGNKRLSAFRSVRLLTNWFGSKAAEDVTASVGPTKEVETPHEYSISRLNSLDELIDQQTSSLAHVVKHLRKFYTLLQKQKFQSALDFLEEHFAAWLSAVKADNIPERQKAFKFEVSSPVAFFSCRLCSVSILLRTPSEAPKTPFKQESLLLLSPHKGV
uniref:Serine/threonine-protein kinase ULK3 n=1 Tax=Schistocephalus solidus TaxID=70667 RepID=A0A0X3PHP6_SCHSO